MPSAACCGHACPGHTADTLPNPQSTPQEHGNGGAPPPRTPLNAAFPWALYDDWWRHAPPEWRRKASGRGAQDFLFTPHADDLT